jgi:hypothetical protein
MAIVIGTAVAGPVFETFTQLMKYLGLTNLSALEAISLMWVKEPSWVLGILGALGVGAWVSLIMYYSTRVWGTDHFPIKAMLIGMTSESLVFNIFGILAKNERLIQNVSGNYVHATAAALAGLAAGFFLKRFIFPDTRK